MRQVELALLQIILAEDTPTSSVDLRGVWFFRGQGYLSIEENEEEPLIEGNPSNCHLTQFLEFEKSMWVRGEGRVFFKT